MFSSGSTLRTSADFDNAIMFWLKIEVWQDEASLITPVLLNLIQMTQFHL
ncbi:hypothetical protein [Paenibacillus sp. GP183]|nr:hypothetical protein [Paenibacillus sp. GP183]SEB73833.1 hypothetical protein SAMN05443246_1751 [Paenibacillus sp. GP183]